MRILILGAYGLIGLPVSNRLLAEGHAVVGLARSAARGQAMLPDAEFLAVDLATLTQVEDWIPHLQNIDAVVNASGVLQGGLGNRPDLTQNKSIIALIAACIQLGIEQFIQISAPDATTKASTEFFRSKAVADSALIASDLNWTLLRPGLVLAPQSYGGTALIRMLVATPLVQPVFLPNVLIQTIHIDDVVDAVLMALNGALNQQDVDLVESEPHRLVDILLSFRSWLGFSPPKQIWRVAGPIAYLTAKLADGLGWLGWQSALRSTSLSVLKDGVQGDPGPWLRLTGKPALSLEQSLRRLPSTRQERLAARTALAYPILLTTLALFWIASGVIGLWQFGPATQYIEASLPHNLAAPIVIGGAVADIVIGLLIAFRPTVRLGCLLSLVLAGGYLAGSAILTPGLWTDPLGPMVKVFPAIALALAVAALSEER